MTDLTQAARQALEALYQAREHVTVYTDGPWQKLESDCHAAIAALRAALEAQQEPVAWEHESGLLMYQTEAGHYAPGKLRDRGWRPLYAAPQPQQGWVLVPEEPTMEMVEIGAGVIDDNGGNARWADIREAWAAMLAARPKETT